MQIKKVKEVLTGQCDIIGVTLDEVESMICDICVDWLIFNIWCFLKF